MKSSALLIFSSLLITHTSLSQKFNEGLVVRTDGFLINLGGDVIFQPCEDTTLTVWQAFDGRSFGIWCNQITGDQYCEAVEKLGDSLDVTIKFATDSSYGIARFSYFYCTLESTMFFIGNHPNDFKMYDQPQYTIQHNQKSYPLKAFYIREVLRKVIPKRLSDLRLMYKYYIDKGYSVPVWLEKEFKQRSSKLKSG